MKKIKKEARDGLWKKIQDNYNSGVIFNFSSLGFSQAAGWSKKTAGFKQADFDHCEKKKASKKSRHASRGGIRARTPRKDVWQVAQSKGCMSN